jgi:hypothetical protein
VTRQTRLVAVLFVISGVGVAGLMMVANQYRKALAGTVASQGATGEAPPVRAARLVDGFLAARRAVQLVIVREPAEVRRLTAAVTGDVAAPDVPVTGAAADLSSLYRTERLNAFVARGLSYDDYTLVRRTWRSWRLGAPVADRALTDAFAARREELASASLGPAEALDDAIR